MQVTQNNLINSTISQLDSIHEQKKPEGVYKVIKKFAKQISKEPQREIAEFKKAITVKNIELILNCKKLKKCEKKPKKGKSEIIGSIYSAVKGKSDKIKGNLSTFSQKENIPEFVRNSSLNPSYMNYDLMINQLQTIFKKHSTQFTQEEIRECFKDPILRKGFKPLFDNKQESFRFLKAVHEYRTIEEAEKKKEVGEAIIKRFIPEETDLMTFEPTQSDPININSKQAAECLKLFNSKEMAKAFDNAESAIVFMIRDI